MEAYRELGKREKHLPWAEQETSKTCEAYKDKQAEAFKPFRNQHDMEAAGDVRIYPVFISAQKLLDPRKDFEVVLDYYKSQEYRSKRVDNGGQGWDVYSKDKNMQGETQLDTLTRHTKHGRKIKGWNMLHEEQVPLCDTLFAAFTRPFKTYLNDKAVL